MSHSTRAADGLGRALADPAPHEQDVPSAPISPEEQLRRSLGVTNATNAPQTSSPDAMITIPLSQEPPNSTTNLLIPTDNDDEESRLINYDLPIIKCVNLHKTYLMGLDGVPALRGVNLSIYKGEFVIILGKSGGGKTSLLNILGTFRYFIL